MFDIDVCFSSKLSTIYTWLINRNNKQVIDYAFSFHTLIQLQFKRVRNLTALVLIH